MEASRMDIFDSEEVDMEYIEERRKKSDQCSAKIAEKLLQGWTLLQDCCPAGCPVPLVRNKAKEMFCVSCGRKVVRESDLPQPSTQTPTPTQTQAESAPEASQPRQQEPTRNPRASSPHTEPPGAPLVNGHAPFQPIPIYTSSTGAHAPAALPPPAAPQQASSLLGRGLPVVFPGAPLPALGGLAGTCGTVVGGAGGVGGVGRYGEKVGLGAGAIGAAVSALVLKIEQSAVALSSSGNVGECVQLCNLIQSCGAAIDALHKIDTARL